MYSVWCVVINVSLLTCLLLTIIAKCTVCLQKSTCRETATLRRQQPRASHTPSLDGFISVCASFNLVFYKLSVA